MSIYLKKITNDIGDLEYLMYQEIPYLENGTLNELNRVTLDSFYKLVDRRVKEEYLKLDEINNPRISYILYDNDYPVGEVCIRPVLNDYYKKNSGNIGYKIRPSKRNLGYGNKILSLALDECKKLNMREVILQCYDYNKYSLKVIKNNNGKLISKDNDVEIYMIRIS